MGEERARDLGADEDAAQVHAEHAVPLLEGVADGLARRDHPGVEDDGAQCPAEFGGPLAGAPEDVGVGRVADDGVVAVAELAGDVGDRAVQVERDDVVAVLGEPPGDGLAEALGGAGDDDAGRLGPPLAGLDRGFAHRGHGRLHSLSPGAGEAAPLGCGDRNTEK